jgi:hypothetical protein
MTAQKVLSLRSPLLAAARPRPASRRTGTAGWEGPPVPPWPCRSREVACAVETMQPATRLSGRARARNAFPGDKGEMNGTCSP